MKFSPIGLHPIHSIPIFSQHLITTFFSQITKDGGCYMKNDSIVNKFGIKSNRFCFFPTDLFRAFSVPMFNMNLYKGTCQGCEVDHAAFRPLTECQKVLVKWMSVFGNSAFPGLFRSLMLISCVFTLPHLPVRNSAEGRDQPYSLVSSSGAICSPNHSLRALLGGPCSGLVISSLHCAFLICFVLLLFHI